MNLIKKLRNLEIRLDTITPYLNVFSGALFSIGLLSLIATAIWLGGPYISIRQHTPLLETERRIYLILLIFLAWLLKFLIIDLDVPNPFHYKNREIRKKLFELQNRFYGAANFLEKNTLSRQSQKKKLSELPCYLFIGPRNAGKTTLLVNSGIHYILQKQFQSEDMHHPGTSENCDWWVTREASIIDVPGKYLSASDGINDVTEEYSFYSILWMFFLRLMKKNRGKTAVNGIIIALPAPEIIKNHDHKNYNSLIRDLFQRIHDTQKMFTSPINCQLVITKCDLLPGFSEFFAETSTEETNQAWGVTLPIPKPGEKLTDIFTSHFNTLIKNLNHQLLSRLHQERNPLARPVIKDFPLQIERIKEFANDFIKKLSTIKLNASLKGIYLTSAFQPDLENKDIQQPADASTRVIQIFEEPGSSSRTYFVKQFFTHGINQFHTSSSTKGPHWKTYAAYAASFAAIGIAAIVLGRDFQEGVQQSYVLQQNLADYQNKASKFHNPGEQLIGTIHLLNTLQQPLVKKSRFDFTWLTSFYSHQSRKKANEAYQAALSTILLPEIKNFLEEFLSNPVNKNSSNIYAVLKSYLMMGDAMRFDGAYITFTLQEILPKSMPENERNDLMNHLKTSLQSTFTPMTLNTKKIQETRQYLTGLSPLKLSYLILKNLDGNNVESDIVIESKPDMTPIFSNQQITSHIPAMFTAKLFNTVLSQQANIAINEMNTGNWVLGNAITQKNNPNDRALLEQLRVKYVSEYIEIWENLLDDIRLSIPTDLATTDAMIVNIIGNSSPLLHFLKTVHDNTNFDALNISSTRLQRINAMVEKGDGSEKMLYSIFASMQSLHLYLQTILHAEDTKQAAFNAVSTRMLSRGTPDAITQLRVIAESCPPPIRQWLVKITDSSWNYLMQEAGSYLDISWNTKVIPYYRNEIAGHYPFSTNTDQEVSFQKFTQFFGRSGIVLSFYNNYLQPFVDTSTADWHWKLVDGKPLPFSAETLRQIQYAIRIHHSFFPNEDNKLFVQFALQPYKFGKQVKSVAININNEHFIDTNDSGYTHSFTLQDNNATPMSSIQLTFNDADPINRHFKGSWGWLKLLNQSFESILTKKETLINLSLNEHPAKYILSSDNQANPFMSLNLQLFHLPQQLSDEKV